MNGFGNALDVAGCSFGSQRTIADKFGEILTLDIVHREIMVSFEYANIVDDDNIGMLQAAGRLRLELESAHFFIARQVPVQNHLYRNSAIQTHLAGFEND